MGERVWVWGIVLGNALSGCVGASARDQPPATAHEVQVSPLPPAPAPPAVTRIEAGNEPGPIVDPLDDAPPVLLYDHGSGSSSKSFSDSPAVAAAASPPPVAPVSNHADGGVSNAGRVVGEMRADFRVCYQQALGQDRNVAGTIRVTIRVTADGSVSNASGETKGLPQSLIDCVLARAYQSKFEPPEGGSAVIAVPVKFVRQ
jgi:hypothetical protein